MGKLLVKERSIVVPGDALAEGMDFLPSVGSYRSEDRIFASRLGLVNVSGNVIRIIPLSGRYVPKRGDTVIGTVEDVSMNGWRININCAYSSMLSVRDATSEFIARGADLTQYFNIGDYIVANIAMVTSQKLVDLSTKGPGLRKLRGGRILEVNTNKVPRIIGKQGSMISMVKQTTGCRIIVGQNGWIWLDGEPENELIAIETIKKIERESHTSGLTERIKLFLEEKTGGLKKEAEQ